MEVERKEKVVRKVVREASFNGMKNMYLAKRLNSREIIFLLWWDVFAFAKVRLFLERHGKYVMEWRK